MKYKIEKNTVQETLVIPLYARKICSEIYKNIYQDEMASILINKIDYDFSLVEKKKLSFVERFGFLEVAMRMYDIKYELKDYISNHPQASVVNLGCGLDSSARLCDNGKIKIYNVDFPDVIELRNKLLPPKEREENIACDLNDRAWMDKIDSSNGVIFFASGVFYYFLKEQVRALVCNMASKFSGGILIFDAANSSAVKMITKTWLKKAEIKNVGAYFSVSDSKKEISSWSKEIKVSSKGYMLGYNDLKDPSVSSFARFLSKVGDRVMKMQIVKISFGEEK